MAWVISSDLDEYLAVAEGFPKARPVQDTVLLVDAAVTSALPG